MSAAIEAAHLSFAFEHGHDVLSDINFRIEAGERVSILGGNGAGKSTLVWCLAGLLRPRGELRIFGHDARTMRDRIGLVFQNPEDQLFMPSIREDLTLPQINRGAGVTQAAKCAENLLARVGLMEHAERPASKLSFGQRKRAAIAAALVNNPEIMILDEPTAELDGRAVRELKETLRNTQGTLILVTHDLQFADELTQRCLVMSDGRIVSSRPTVEIVSDREMLLQVGLV